MAKKIKNTKKAGKSNKVLVVRERERGLIFAGASRLLTQPRTPKENYERKLILAVSKALGISPLSVVILGSLPYIDNKGRKEKLGKYAPGTKFEYNWVRRSESDIDKAVCEARITKNGKPVSGMPWVVGECSPGSTKMSTLRGYQNHIAQTRAENRAFEYLYGLKLRDELLIGIQRMMDSKEIDHDTATKALAASTMSAEEHTGAEKLPVIVMEENEPAGNAASKKQVEEIISIGIRKGATNIKQIVAGVNKFLKTNVKDLSELTGDQAKTVMVTLLQKKSQSKK